MLPLNWRCSQSSILGIVLLLFIIPCTVEESSERAGENRVIGIVEELRIGQLDGEEEYLIGNINGIAVGSNGEVFVSDHQIPVVRMYDSEGNYIKDVGQEGRGPGEYLTIGGMRTFPDGRLAIWDMRNSKIIVFDQQGDFVEEYLVTTGFFSADIFEVDGEGNFYVKSILSRFLDMPDMEFGWAKISPEGEIIDTIRVPVDIKKRAQVFVLFTASGDAYPFDEKLLSSMSPLGYLITGTNDEYAFKLQLTEAPHVRIKRDYTPVHINEEERAEWERWVNRFGLKYNLPDTKPSYKKIMTDSQGRIWIWRYVEAVYVDKVIGQYIGAESKWWEPPTFDVYSPDGSYYATVILPLNAQFYEARDDHIWAELRGEQGETYVVRYRLEALME